MFTDKLDFGCKKKESQKCINVNLRPSYAQSLSAKQSSKIHRLLKSQSKSTQFYPIRSKLNAKTDQQNFDLRLGMHIGALRLNTPHRNPRLQTAIALLPPPAQQCHRLRRLIAASPRLHVRFAAAFQRRVDEPLFPQQHSGHGGEYSGMAVERWPTETAQR